MKIAHLLLFVSAPVCLLAQIRFGDATARSGIDFTLRNGAKGGMHLVELMPGGVAAFDLDNDGCQDLFFANGAALPSLEKEGPEFWNRLYRNNCDGTFSDITQKAGVAGTGYSMGVAAADYDGDGYTDLFIAGVNRNQLLRNRGDRTFEDTTAKAGLAGHAPGHRKPWSIAAGWLDADLDGRPDLFVSNYVSWDPASEPKCRNSQGSFYCHPDQYRGLSHQIFRNAGSGKFVDLSAASGIAKYTGKGMGVAFADYDRDGRPDIFVGNDSMRNFLFRNAGDFRFDEVGLDAGASLGEHGRPIATMGVDFRDLDNDRRPDVVMTAMVNDAFLLLRNLGPPAFFEDFTIRSGLAAGTRQMTGWGVGAYDFDNDGRKDLFFANAHFPRLSLYLGVPAPQPAAVFRNTGQGRFENVSSAAGPALQASAHHRGAAFADFNNDGRIDVALSCIQSPARLLLNETPDAGGWIALDLRAGPSRREVWGAEVTATAAGMETQLNQVTTSVGYTSSSERFVRFGLGRARGVRVEVAWPGGAVEARELTTINKIVPWHSRSVGAKLPH